MALALRLVRDEIIIIINYYLQQQLTHVYGLSWWRPGLHGRRRMLPGGRLLFWRWLCMLSRSLHR
jgi:hypothetical protein